MATIEEVLKNYIEKRDRKAEMSKRHEAEMAPLNEAMAVMENWFMDQMNKLGTTQMKAEGVGTVFKSTSTSCQMADATAFKQFVFTPAVNGIYGYLQAVGFAVGPADIDTISNIIRDMPMWDMIDFRAGKKGIVEYVSNEHKTVPGVNVNTVASVGIRRA